MHGMTRRRANKVNPGVWRVWRVDCRPVDESMSVECWVGSILGIRCKK